MPNSKNDLFSFVLLIVSSITNGQDRFINPCDNDPPNPAYYKTATYGNNTCLFTRLLLTDQINRQDVFELSRANRKCNDTNGATLARVQSREKNEFIVKTFKNISHFSRHMNQHLIGIALDISVRNGQFVWGDGTPVVAPVPIRGTGLTPTTFQYAVIQMSTIPGIAVGEWNYTDSAHLGNLTVGVICELPWIPPNISAPSKIEKITSDSNLKTFGTSECVMFGFDCYFLLKNESFQANKRNAINQTIFDLTFAELACDGKKAFLPIIESEYENNFVNHLPFDIFNETGWKNARIPLAIYHVNDSSDTWATNANEKMFYTPSNWLKNDTARFTYMVRNETAGPTWVDMVSKTIDEPIAVVCKKYRFDYMEEPKPVIRLPVTPCDTNNSSKYTKTAIYKNVCYFVIDGATDGAHSNSSGGRSLDFWKDVAEASCADESASTLAVEDASIISFVKATFNSSDFTNKPLAGIYLGIEKWHVNKRYYWTTDRNSEVNLNTFGGQLKWTKTTPGYDFTYLDINSYDWRDSLETLVHGNYIGVLCTKPLVYEKPTTTTAATTTTKLTTISETTTEPKTTQATESATSAEVTQNQTSTACKCVDHGFEKIKFLMVTLVTKIWF